MGRGSQEQRQLSNQQLDTYNTMMAKEEATRDQGRANLLPKLEDIYAHPGYDDATKAGITTSTMGAMDAGMDSGEQAVNKSAAVRHNDTGIAGNLVKLAQARASGKAQAAGGLQKTFADTAMQQKMQALQQMQGMYGIDTNVLQNVAGLPIGALQAHAAGISKFGVGAGPFSMSSG
jgi:hypothetical protein